MAFDAGNALCMPLPEQIAGAMERLEQAGYACYVVGGAVRDWLAGRRPHDYDLCTSARPEQIRDVFDGQPIIETGLRHGTVTLLLDDTPVELTTFRTEGAYSDGRRPDSVAFVTDITRDLARRDFTVDAMAWSSTRGFCDPFDGRGDLKCGVLRCVGDPAARFQEDALRILRALRFAATRGFRIEELSAQALHAQKSLLSRVSAERITEELLRLLCGAYVGEVLMKYADVITEILPELAPMVGFRQCNPHHKYDVWEHSVRACEAIRPEPLLRLVMLLHDCGKPDTFFTDEDGIGHFYGHPAQSQAVAARAVKHLRLPGRMERELLYLVRHHDAPLGETVRVVRRRLAAHGEEHFRRLLAIKKADCVGQGTAPENLTLLLETERQLEIILRLKDCLSVRDLAVSGYDLQDWGASGREIGAILSEMLSRVLDDPVLNTRIGLRVIFEELREKQECVHLTVRGLTAGHGARGVRRMLETMPEIWRADIRPISGEITLYGQNIPLEQVRSALTAAGFEVVI